MPNHVGHPIGDQYIRLVCTGRGTHHEREIDYITGCVDDTGRLLLFAHGFRWNAKGSTKLTLDTVDSVLEKLNPAPHLGQQPPGRSVPVQRSVAEDEAITWRFVCRSCRMDLREPTTWVATLFRAVAATETPKFDLSHVRP